MIALLAARVSEGRPDGDRRPKVAFELGRVPAYGAAPDADQVARNKSA